MDQDDALYDAALSLANIYSADLSSSFPSQLLSFREVLRSEISKLDTVKDSAEILITSSARSILNGKQCVIVFPHTTL